MILSTCNSGFDRMRVQILTAAFAAFAISSLPVSAIAADAVDFGRDIRPILSEHCLHCHGPDESQRQAGLRIDRREDAVAAAIVPGDPSASEFLRRVRSQDEDQRMPPPDSGKALTAEQIGLLTQWI